MSIEEIKNLEDRIVSRLRVEMAAIQLGDDRLLNEAEAASLLGIHPKTLSLMRRSNEIEAGYIGTSPRYALGTIRRLMREVTR